MPTGAPNAMNVFPDYSYQFLKMNVLKEAMTLFILVFLTW
jgi:hypothetical protein